MIHSKAPLLAPRAAFLLLPLVVAAACSKHNSSAAPQANVLSVVTIAPVNGSTGVPVNVGISATFSQTLLSSSITTTTFTLVTGFPPVPVQGSVVYSNATATFWPAAFLAADTGYTATITTAVRSVTGIGLPADFVWRFTTGTTVQPGVGVNLGTAGTFAILAKAAISTVPTSAVTGNVGVSPAAASFITGFALTLDASGTFSTSSQVTGRVYAADYTPPTPSNLTTSVLDMQTAFTDAAGRAPGVTELGAGNIGGLTLDPGVYKWGTGLLIPTDVTLTGGSNDVWIFQIAQDLTMSSATNVILTGGAQPQNVFWQVTGLVDIGTTAQFRGIILCATQIRVLTGASVTGRLLAQTNVSIDASTIVQPQ